MQLTCFCNLLYFKIKPITPNNASLIVWYLPLYHRTSPPPLWNSLYGVDLLLPYIRFSSVLPFLQSLSCVRVFHLSPIYRFRPDCNRNEILSRSNCAQVESVAIIIGAKRNGCPSSSNNVSCSQSANLGKNNEPIQDQLLSLINCKSVILHHLTILSFSMVRPVWDNCRDFQIAVYLIILLRTH